MPTNHLLHDLGLPADAQVQELLLHAFLGLHEGTVAGGDRSHARQHYDAAAPVGEVDDDDVWQLGKDGLALVAYEQDFSVDQLMALAESAVLPED